MAQGDGELPVFFPFADRDNHDLTGIAQKFSFDDNLGARALHESLLTEYGRKDRYWRVIYPSYVQFKSQYDACVNGELERETGGRLGPEKAEKAPPIIKPKAESLSPSEPSEELKEQVKARDAFRCLCCGESKRRLLEIDHVAPSYYGGDSSLDNLQTLCRICNRTKALNTLNFHIHRTYLTSRPSHFPILDLPKEPWSCGEWEEFLRRSINFFYRCSAVDYIRIGHRGQYFHEWYVYLYAGNEVVWLKPHLRDLVKRVNYARQEAGIQEIEGIAVGAPDQKDQTST
jgi:hypothetical protein